MFVAVFENYFFLILKISLSSEYFSVFPLQSLSDTLMYMLKLGS